MFFAGKSEKVYKLLDKHLDSVVACIDSFSQFMDAYLSRRDTNELTKLYADVDKYEGEADDNRRSLIPELSGMILANTRAEILDISQAIDIVANKAQSISRRILVEHIKMPLFVNNEIAKIMNTTKIQLEVLTDAIQLLFNNYLELEGENNLLKKIKALESEVDELELECVRAIFNSDMPLAEKMHAGRLINALADVSDYIEDIADKIQIMLVIRKG